MSSRAEGDCIGPLSAETISGSLAPMSGAVIPDPEVASCGLVGLLARPSQTRRSMTAMHFGDSDDRSLGPVEVPKDQVDPLAPGKVLAFNAWNGSTSQAPAPRAHPDGVLDCWSRSLAWFGVGVSISSSHGASWTNRG